MTTDNADHNEYDNLDEELQRLLNEITDEEQEQDRVRGRLRLNLNPDNATQGPLPPRERTLEEFLTTSSRNITHARRNGQRALYSRISVRTFPALLMFSVKYAYRRTPDLSSKKLIQRLLIEQGLDVLGNMRQVTEAQTRHNRDLAELAVDDAWSRATSTPYVPIASSLRINVRSISTIFMTEQSEELIGDFGDDLGLSSNEVAALAFMAAFSLSTEWIPGAFTRVCWTEVERFGQLLDLRRE